jgi:hypothetical protein
MRGVFVFGERGAETARECVHHVEASRLTVLSFHLVEGATEQISDCVCPRELNATLLLT